jgi:hypothetical protein
MKQLLGLMLLVTLGATFLSISGFEDSLHYTRQGKATWYAKENGGFELLTGIPMSELACQNCHAATKADGTPIDAETYEPDCNDCHNPADGFTNVESSVCVGCHSRQGTEITLSGHPTLGPLFSDVHRDMGMGCVDCHTSNEMHGDDTQYASMFEEGATETRCVDCHPPESGKMAQNTAHDIHLESVDCAACHAKTVVTCYNCHFETEVEADMKRFYGPPPMNGFAMLVNDERKGKVATASFQSLSFGDTTFYAVGPYAPHTISAEARDCQDCHMNENVQTYLETGEIPIVQWDPDQGKLVNTKGIIPAPPDWQTAWKLDFVRFLGEPSDALDNPVDPAKWEFLKDHADLAQMLYATPLTEDQMAKLEANVTATDPEEEVPAKWRLNQNYPNPFNPSTNITFYLSEPTSVSLKLYDVAGRHVRTLLEPGILTAGEHQVRLDAEELNSGIYVYRLKGERFDIARMLSIVQ